jgi:hybrid cluster-associated redox disulfide protein
LRRDKERHRRRAQDRTMSIRRDSLVDKVMKGHPATIRVFLDFKLGCVGCPIGCFHTVEDACREHGIGAGEFLTALRASAA